MKQEVLFDSIHNVTKEISLWIRERLVDQAAVGQGEVAEDIKATQNQTLTLIHIVNILSRALFFQRGLQRYETLGKALVIELESSLKTLTEALILLNRFDASPPATFDVAFLRVLLAYAPVYNHILMEAKERRRGIAGAVRLRDTFLHLVKVVFKLFIRSVKTTSQALGGRQDTPLPSGELILGDDDFCDIFDEKPAGSNYDSKHRQAHHKGSALEGSAGLTGSTNCTVNLADILVFCTVELGLTLSRVDADVKAMDQLIETHEGDLRRHNLFFKVELLILLHDADGDPVEQLTNVLLDINEDIKSGEFSVLPVVIFFEDLIRAVKTGALALSSGKSTEAKSRCTQVVKHLINLWQDGSLGLNARLKLLQLIIPGIHTGLFIANEGFICNARPKILPSSPFSRLSSKLLTCLPYTQVLVNSIDDPEYRVRLCNAR
ncbi:hypothetical protein AAMO2058_000972100 [Amorphochlora amoebiformis]